MFKTGCEMFILYANYKLPGAIFSHKLVDLCKIMFGYLPAAFKFRENTIVIGLQLIRMGRDVSIHSMLF